MRILFKLDNLILGFLRYIRGLIYHEVFLTTNLTCLHNSVILLVCHATAVDPRVEHEHLLHGGSVLRGEPKEHAEEVHELLGNAFLAHVMSGARMELQKLSHVHGVSTHHQGEEGQLIRWQLLRVRVFERKTTKVQGIQEDPQRIKVGWGTVEVLPFWSVGVSMLKLEYFWGHVTLSAAENREWLLHAVTVSEIDQFCNVMVVKYYVFELYVKVCYPADVMHEVDAMQYLREYSAAELLVVTRDAALHIVK